MSDKITPFPPGVSPRTAPGSVGKPNPVRDNFSNPNTPKDPLKDVAEPPSGGQKDEGVAWPNNPEDTPKEKRPKCEVENIVRKEVSTSGTLPYPPVKSFSDLYSSAASLASAAVSSGICTTATSDPVRFDSTSPGFLWNVGLTRELEAIDAKPEIAGYGPNCSIGKDRGEWDALTAVLSVYQFAVGNFYAQPQNAKIAATEKQAKLTSEVNSTFDLPNPDRGHEGQAEPQPNTSYEEMQSRDHSDLLQQLEDNLLQSVIKYEAPDPLEKERPEKKDDDKKSEGSKAPNPERVGERVVLCGQIVPELTRKDTTTDPDTDVRRGGGKQDSPFPPEKRGPQGLDDVYIPGDSRLGFFYTSDRVPRSLICHSCMVVGNKTYTTKETKKIRSSERNGYGFLPSLEAEEDVINPVEDISSAPVDDTVQDGAPYVYGRMWVAGRLTKIENQNTDICVGTNLATVEFKLSSNPLKAIAGLQAAGVIIDETLIRGATYALENREDGAYAVMSGFPTQYLTLDGKTAAMQFLVVQGDYKTNGNHRPELMSPSTAPAFDTFSINSGTAEIVAYAASTPTEIHVIEAYDAVTQVANILTYKTLPIVSSSINSIDTSAPVVDSELSGTGMFFLLHRSLGGDYITMIDRFGRIRKAEPGGTLNGRIRNKSASGRERLLLSRDMPYHYDFRESVNTSPGDYLPFERDIFTTGGVLFTGNNNATDVLLYPNSYIFWGHETFTSTYHPNELPQGGGNLGVLYASGTQYHGRDLHQQQIREYTGIVELIQNGSIIRVTSLSDILSREINYSQTTDENYGPHDYGVNSYVAYLSNDGVFHNFEDVDIFLSLIYSSILIMDKTKGIWVQRIIPDKTMVLNPNSTGGVSGVINTTSVVGAPLPIGNHTFDTYSSGKYVFYISSSKRIIRVDILEATWEDFGVVDDSIDPIDVTKPVWSTNGGRSSQRPELWFLSISGKIYRVKPYETSLSTNLTQMVSDMLTDQEISHEIIDTVGSTAITGFAVKSKGTGEIGKLAKHLFMLSDLAMINAGGKMYLTSKSSGTSWPYKNFGSESKSEAENTVFNYDFSILDFRRKARVLVQSDDEIYGGQTSSALDKKTVITNISFNRYEDLVLGAMPRQDSRTIELPLGPGLKSYHSGIYSLATENWLFNSKGGPDA